MKRATAVIGANAGDEGKGKMVDYFAAKLSADKVVVRFNGGAQAGHTVVLPDCRRHVFAHFGSGTLAGAATYLSKHFVCNPLLFWREHHRLVDLAVSPIVVADPRCFITTPYDMLINQAIEDHRGNKRHGSTGVGFGETIERNIYPAFALWKSDLDDRDKLTAKLKLIRDRWLPARLVQRRIPRLSKDDDRLSDKWLEKFSDAAFSFGKAVPSAGLEFLSGKEIIFEGAQGLLLDMDNKEWFPHVTRSNTGLTNVMPIASALGLAVDVVYVSRTYLTRHGAGSLPAEFRPDPPVIDDTNTEHPYQGTFRFSRLDHVSLLDRIRKDATTHSASSWCVAWTCLDHSISEGVMLTERTNYVSAGPRRDQVDDT